MQAADDEAILSRAKAEDRILVSADTDFGTMLALRSETRPSVVLFRLTARRVPVHQAELLRANLPALETELQNGCIVILEDSRIRVRRLPVGGG
jgi:predicted nuclease of predicted toxin-antitoxin system